MNIVKSLLSLCLLTFFSAFAWSQQVVVKDGDVELSQEELASAVSRWTDQMRDVAIKDEGDRLELINLSIANKKMALEAEKVAARDPELYQKYVAGIRSYQRDFVLRQYAESIVYPDFTELAREQYEIKKERIALNPEKRLSSHILFSSPPGLPRDDLLIEAQGVLDELRAGADFVEMVKLHSDEPNAAAKEGLFNLWMTYGDKSVSPPYSEGVFSIANIGEYSELVQTQFGVHIIRLDGIQEKTYKPFDEIKGKLIQEFEAEYKTLAMKDYVATFQMSDETIIDDAAVEAILEPYKKGE